MDCKKCSVAFMGTDKKVKCDLCEMQFHISCIGMSLTNFGIFSKFKSLHWFCESCDNGNIIQEMRELRDMKAQLNAMSQQIENLSNKMNATDPTVHSNQPALQREQIIDIIREENEIEMKKNNLCIFNLPEGNSDVETFTNLCTQQLGIPRDNFEVNETIRVGAQEANKPRALIVKLKSLNSKVNILKKAPTLRNYAVPNSTLKIYIAPDLTMKQREFQKELRDELKIRRENGEQVIIKRNKIVPSDRPNPSRRH